MFDRKTIVGGVIWPNAAKAKLHLVEEDGEVLGSIDVDLPIKGDDLVKLIPEGCGVLLEKCNVMRLRGPLMRKTTSPFNSIVVTERNSMTLDERMARLEGKLVQQQRRELALKSKIAKLTEKDDDNVLENDDQEASPTYGATGTDAQAGPNDGPADDGTTDDG